MRRAYLWPGLSCWLVVLSAASLPAASLRLPAVIGDNMVLQRDKAVPIWGWADKGEKVTVALAGQSVEATADDRGRWKVTLDKLEKAGPLEMTVKTASSSLTVKNILVGEVWVCSGQSNMEMGIGACRNAKEEIAAADYPQIRLFTVAKVRAAQPARDVKGHWAECSPKTVSADGWGGFSAAAYYFGRTLHKELKVPVGLIHTSWGGTAAEEWTSKKAFQSEPKLKGLGGSQLYNGMIAPLIPFAIRGAIWYQGEANVGRAYQYRTLLPTMIRNWRNDWGEGDFPFYLVQIAPFRYNNPLACAELWEAQLLTMKNVPHTGMAVTTDITELGDIHPHNKQEVGRRLALWAGQGLLSEGGLLRPHLPVQ